ncbi:MAG: dTMP kinase [Dehalococcoidia bacterium]|nr:dTMP kinase [Dehalococcoidia bacterium]
MPARTSKTKRRGLFISFEGGEGAGKSTQTQLLLKRLMDVGESVVLVKEPGSTPLGSRLRGLLKGEVSMSDKAELLLFLAARAELVTTVVDPALDDGVNVIADRFSDSTFAYQGQTRGFTQALIADLNQFATGGLSPDITFLLNLPPEESLRRTRPKVELDNRLIADVRQAEEGQQKFESRPLAFHKRVAEAYRKLAAAEPERWCVLDGRQSVDALSEQVWERVQDSLKKAKRNARRRTGVPVGEQGRPRLI